jgi:hypothetical protein
MQLCVQWVSTRLNCRDLKATMVQRRKQQQQVQLMHRRSATNLC